MPGIPMNVVNKGNIPTEGRAAKAAELVRALSELFAQNGVDDKEEGMFLSLRIGADDGKFGTMFAFAGQESTARILAHSGVIEAQICYAGNYDDVTEQVEPK